MKKFLALLLALSACCSMVACGDRSSLVEEDGTSGPEEGKTPLYIGVYDGAVGYEWALQVEKMYEADNPDVDVIVRHQKTRYDDSSLLLQIEYNDEDIYFGSNNSLVNLAKNGLVADLSEIITEKIYDNNGNLVESGATKSIQDTLWDEWESFCKLDNKFYAIPNFMPVAGITYDADLFEDKGYTVPETYDELITLMNRMVTDKITPFTVANSYPYIVDAALAFYANYEGKNNFLLNSTYNGVDSNLGEITLQTAWKLQAQEGRKAYLQFYYDLAKNRNYATTSSYGSQTHLNSQDAFILSQGTDNRIAMIIENSFWEREAKGTFDIQGDINSAWGFGKRNFKYMIAPVNKETDRKTVYCSYPYSYTFVNKNSDQMELAMDFLQYVQSRKALATYTIYSGCLRPYDYTFTDEEYAAATPYTRSLIDLTRRDDVDFVTMGASNEVARNMGSANYQDEWANKATTSYGTHSMPFSAFIAYSGLTVDAYYKGYSTYMSESYYTNIYKSVYGGK